MFSVPAVAKSKRLSRPMCHKVMSSDMRPDVPVTKASSKNVALAAGSVSAGIPGSSVCVSKISLQYSERTSTHVHSPSSGIGYLARARGNTHIEGQPSPAKPKLSFQDAAIKAILAEYEATWCKYIKEGRTGIGDIKP